MRRLLPVLALVLAAVSACSSRSDACTDTPTAVLVGIEQGINTADVTISSSGAVPYAGGLLVAGTLTGPGLDDEVAGWYVARLDPPGSISSADSMAAEFTNWPLDRIDLSEAESCLDD